MWKGFTRLATREDVLAVCGLRLAHIHKTLALLVVWHTLHRLVVGMEGAATLPLVAALAAHLLLSCSALVFKVSARTKLPHVLDGLYRAQVGRTGGWIHICSCVPYWAQRLCACTCISMTRRCSRSPRDRSASCCSCSSSRRAQQPQPDALEPRPKHISHPNPGSRSGPEPALSQPRRSPSTESP